MRILNELNWVAELDDIDHEICDIARDAISEIEYLRDQYHNAMRMYSDLLNSLPSVDELPPDPESQPN